LTIRRRWAGATEPGGDMVASPATAGHDTGGRGGLPRHPAPQRAFGGRTFAVWRRWQS